MKTTRYTVSEYERATFYQMPKFLFNETYLPMSNDAKVLYCLLKDRFELSMKNNWINENGELYLKFKREAMMEMLGKGKNTITKIMKELIDKGLVEEVRVGFNQANEIYLLAPADETIPVSADKNRSPKNRDTGVPKTGILESQNLTPNKTDINKTDINKNKEREEVTAEVYFDNQKIIKAMNEYLHVRKQNGLKTTSYMMIDWAEILHSRTPENAEETLKIATASNWPTITKDANMKKAKQCNKTATTKQAKGKYTAPSYNHAETDWSYLEM